MAKNHLAERKKVLQLTEERDTPNRKDASKAKLETIQGRKLTAKTTNTIPKPDTKTAGIYEFDGFHPRIAWNSPEARKALEEISHLCMMKFVRSGISS